MALIQARISETEDALISRYTKKHKITKSEFLRGAVREKLDEDSNAPIFGCARGEFTMSDDFDEPLSDFGEYT
ncbi:MAG: DUF2281 domain-containing protein [Clostridiales Family XIII bacterium]|nr:DUF2281 domain-containing protein [Clostridiales Family XIII bacterium]